MSAQKIIDASNLISQIINSQDDSNAKLQKIEIQNERIKCYLNQSQWYDLKKIFKYIILPIFIFCGLKYLTESYYNYKNEILKIENNISQNKNQTERITELEEKIKCTNNEPSVTIVEPVTFPKYTVSKPKSQQ